MLQATSSNVSVWSCTGGRWSGPAGDESVLARGITGPARLRSLAGSGAGRQRSVQRGGSKVRSARLGRTDRLAGRRDGFLRHGALFTSSAVDANRRRACRSAGGRLRAAALCASHTRTHQGGPPTTEAGPPRRRRSPCSGWSVEIRLRIPLDQPIPTPPTNPRPRRREPRGQDTKEAVSSHDRLRSLGGE
jgi:hypothetical protein